MFCTNIIVLKSSDKYNEICGIIIKNIKVIMMIDSLKINTQEVLRYLGHNNQEISEKILSLIDECKGEIINKFEGKYIYEVYTINRENDAIKLGDTSCCLLGKDINNHLVGCDKCILMAVTLGVGVDRLVGYYLKENVTKGIIFDACATTLIESFCDYIEEEIKEKVCTDITSRFSPGYGDLDIGIQPKIINTLDAYRRIGITTNESLILLPKKSVTAIIGIGKKDRVDKCVYCVNGNNCGYKKEGKNCGN